MEVNSYAIVQNPFLAVVGVALPWGNRRCPGETGIDGRFGPIGFFSGKGDTWIKRLPDGEPQRFNTDGNSKIRMVFVDPTILEKEVGDYVHSFERQTLAGLDVHYPDSVQPDQ
jgi:hypothetical protein